MVFLLREHSAVPGPASAHAAPCVPRPSEGQGQGSGPAVARVWGRQRQGRGRGAWPAGMGPTLGLGQEASRKAQASSGLADPLPTPATPERLGAGLQNSGKNVSLTCEPPVLGHLLPSGFLCPERKSQPGHSEGSGPPRLRGCGAEGLGCLGPWGLPSSRRAPTAKAPLGHPQA